MLDPDEKRHVARFTLNPGNGGSPTIIVSEAWLYKLIMRPDKDDTLPTESWGPPGGQSGLDHLWSAARGGRRGSGEICPGHPSPHHVPSLDVASDYTGLRAGRRLNLGLPAKRPAVIFS